MSDHPPVMDERERRNLDPHAEAVMAAFVWGDELGRQDGGVMDFWDSLSEHRKRICVTLVDRILLAPRAAALPTSEPK